jgi:ubiquinone/menaquinone biosynthesis C-methylase UbiE
MTTTGRDDATYAMGRSEDETKRLIQQAEEIRDFTHRFYQSAGIQPGMRVLDVGTGAGDGALMAAAIVGPTGVVVGIDVNAGILDTARERARAAGHEQVTFVPGDFRTADLDGEFDAVIGRYVLMYLGDPVDALRSVLRHLRPGGVIAFQEYEFTQGSVAYPPSPVFDQGRDWMLRAFAATGMHTDMGFRLYPSFLAAGLADPQVSVSMITGFGPHSGAYEELANILRSLLPVIVAHGIATAEEVGVDTFAARYREDALRRHTVAYRSPTICVWARKPEQPL